MDHKIAIAGATAALIAGSAAAQAAPAQEAPAVPAVSSYSGLLEPIPDAVQRLKLADAQDVQKVQFSLQFGVRPHHHHHHHSSDWYRRNGFRWDGDRGWVTRDYYDHHHHHHHHNNDYYGYYYRR